MAIREIIKIPDPLLKKTSEPIERVDDDLNTLIDDMFQTMYDAPGVGLAAVQIGIARRLLVVDTAREEEEPRNPLCFINPEIVWSSEDMSEYEEGCLSIPDVFDNVARPAQVRVRHIDRDGKQCETLCSDFLATVVQHEIDHLNGVLFIDYLSRLKRDRIVRKFTKLARQARESV